MKARRISVALGMAGLSMVLFGASYAWAHCDGLDGPVVKAAQKALASNNVNLVLVWVAPENEAELKDVFQQTVTVRKLNPETRALADRHLFETLVRLHRTGEGAPYTGLKPAGRDLGLAIPAADKAIESGDPDALEALLVKELKAGLHESFAAVQAKQKYDPNNLSAGRAYVKAYVEYIHFVERLHDAASHSAGGHYEEAASR